MVRHELPRNLDVEALREHGAERLDFHLAEARERGDAFAEVGAAGGLRPEARGLAAVVLRDRGCELANALGHRAGETVDGRLLAEEGLEVGARDGPLAQGRRALP